MRPGRDQQAMQDILDHARRVLLIVEDIPALIEQLQRALGAET